MLTESELKWLRERQAIKHTCEDCWKTEAKKSEEFVRLDRYYGEKNDEPWLLSECEWCKWNPNPELVDIADGDNWSSRDWYAWDDESRTDYHLTSLGREAMDRRLAWGRVREDYKDAAEFSERVALKIASTHGGFSFCDESCGRYNIHDCRWCRLKWARLAVEEEMDG